LTIFIGILLDKAVHVIRMAQIVPGCAVTGDGRRLAVVLVSESFTHRVEPSDRNLLKNKASGEDPASVGVGKLYTLN
jgi:hypothetical protein